MVPKAVGVVRSTHSRALRNALILWCAKPMSRWKRGFAIAVSAAFCAMFVGNWPHTRTSVALGVGDRGTIDARAVGCRTAEASKRLRELSTDVLASGFYIADRSHGCALIGAGAVRVEEVAAWNELLRVRRDGIPPSWWIGKNMVKRNY